MQKMQKVFAIALALLLALSVAGAWAGEIQGKIQEVDPDDRTFVLEDGTQLWVAEGLDMGTLKPGASVTASYEERDGKKIATSFSVSQ